MHTTAYRYTTSESILSTNNNLLNVQSVQPLAEVQIALGIGKMRRRAELVVLENLAHAVSYIGVLAALSKERPLCREFRRELALDQLDDLTTDDRRKLEGVACATQPRP